MSFSVRRVAECTCCPQATPKFAILEKLNTSVRSMLLWLDCGAQPLAERPVRSMKDRHAKEQTCHHSVGSAGEGIGITSGGNASPVKVRT